tara:strand:- start:155 stop:406 length:252 start_codon:yes stop_codon:yes gene_type:complete
MGARILAHFVEKVWVAEAVRVTVGLAWHLDPHPGALEAGWEFEDCPHLRVPRVEGVDDPNRRPAVAHSKHCVAPQEACHHDGE